MLKVMLKLPEEMIEALKAEAKRKGVRRIDAIVREALEEYLVTRLRKQESALEQS